MSTYNVTGTELGTENGKVMVHSPNPQEAHSLAKEADTFIGRNRKSDTLNRVIASGEQAEDGVSVIEEVVFELRRER